MENCLVCSIVVWTSITHGKMLPVNSHAHAARKARGLNFALSLFLHPYFLYASSNGPGRVAQSVTCLATDACLTADPGVVNSIPVRSHTFVEIDHEMISTVILLLPLIHSRRVVVSYKRKYVHELLVNRLFKPAQEKVWLGELTVPQ